MGFFPVRLSQVEDIPKEMGSMQGWNFHIFVGMELQ